jgi:hypothetical protein
MGTTGDSTDLGVVSAAIPVGGRGPATGAGGPGRDALNAVSHGHGVMDRLKRSRRLKDWKLGCTRGGEG